jgi:hypothetical protein
LMVVMVVGWGGICEANASSTVRCMERIER